MATGKRGPKPKTKPNNAETAELRKMKDFDLFMVRVNRYNNDDDRADSQSVEIGKCIRRKVNTSTISVNNLNATQDWRNAGQEGQPVIQWYFPHKTVKTGQVFAAHDTFKKKQPVALNIEISNVIDASEDTDDETEETE